MIHYQPKRTISVSGELELLQMISELISELDTGRYVYEGVISITTLNFKSKSI